MHLAEITRAEMPVDTHVHWRFRRRFEISLNDIPVKVENHHVLGRGVREGNAACRDNDQIGLGVVGTYVPARAPGKT